MLDQSLTQLSQALRNGQISSVELVQHTLEKIKNTQHLNAFITGNEAQALEHAKVADQAIAADNDDPLCRIKIFSAPRIF